MSCFAATLGFVTSIYKMHLPSEKYLLCFFSIPEKILPSFKELPKIEKNLTVHWTRLLRQGEPGTSQYVIKYKSACSISNDPYSYHDCNSFYHQTGDILPKSPCN